MERERRSASPEVSADDGHAALLVALMIAPKRFMLLERRLSVVQLNHRASEDDWSVNDVLAHVRACADTWGKSIAAMLERDHPTLRYVSPRSWMKKSGYRELAYRESLRAYIEQRTALVKRLKQLRPEDWQRHALFTGTTRGHDQTVTSYVERITAHELEHCKQLDSLHQALSAGW
jgi:hypothetical protein